MSETYNSWIVSPRHKSIITILEEIRHKIMNRHVDIKIFANTWITDVSPMARLILEENKDISKSEGDARFIVDQVRRTFVLAEVGNSEEFQCPHVVCALYHLDQEPDDEIESWYRHEVFLKAYQYSIQPVPNMKMWPESNNPSIEPPEVKPMPGRPGRCRRKQKDEPRKKYGKLSKKGVKMTCSRYHQLGHNKFACKSVIDTTSSQSSQPAQPMAPPPNRASQNINSPSMCTDTSTMGREYFATNATGRGRGRDNAQLTNNGSSQPTKRTKKPKQSTGFGIYTDTQSGRIVLNSGETARDRRVIKAARNKSKTNEKFRQ
ncbi:hypothetical protein H5410_036219 [Solanum commersonii]|uniref:Uncharacterized protein n=1 Tax=Solanum commersonii TaxID=4109 RepID=A0A9J5Y2Y8_SOLCO|nr:hypothetical protein H5410_036219 [Solanum commersonii]